MRNGERAGDPIEDMRALHDDVLDLVRLELRKAAARGVRVLYLAAIGAIAVLLVASVTVASALLLLDGVRELLESAFQSQGIARLGSGLLALLLVATTIGLTYRWARRSIVAGALRPKARR